MSKTGDIIRGAGGYLNRNNQLGVGTGYPIGGDEGEIRVQMVDNSPHLYARAGGDWYGINLKPTLGRGASEMLTLGDTSDYIGINEVNGVSMYNRGVKMAWFTQ